MHYVRTDVTLVLPRDLGTIGTVRTDMTPPLSYLWT